MLCQHKTNSITLNEKRRFPYSYQILHFVMTFEHSEFEKLNFHITGFHME